MYKNAVDSKKEEFEKSIEHFVVEIGQIRTGRANPALVENVMVDYYGTKTPLKQIASINVPESRLLVIQPWDKDGLVNIEAAIRDSDLGFNPNNDGQVIRERGKKDEKKELYEKDRDSAGSGNHVDEFFVCMWKDRGYNYRQTGGRSISGNRADK